jgi:membrane peptidoglycan carboxypeptidase
VKNVFTGGEKSLWRKYVEAVYSLRVEREFTKEEILLLYANLAQTGPGMYGYREASLRYFGVEPRELTKAQAVFIVSLLPDPVGRSEWIRQGQAMPERARRRLLWKIRSLGDSASPSVPLRSPLSLRSQERLRFGQPIAKSAG